jgi:ribosomal protein S18 acetylase RimI-like enzyme
MSPRTDLAFEVRAYDASRALDVARLHALALPDAFLTSLGAKFLARLYAALDTAPGTWILVAIGSGEVTLGFVSGAADVRRTVRHAMLHGGASLAAAMARSLLRPGTWRRVAETLAYPLRSLRPGGEGPAPPPVRAELLSIAVDPAARGAGVGRSLVDELEVRMRGAAASGRYRVVTAATDPRSNAFYAGVGFQRVCEFEHHGRRMSLYEKALTRE